MNRRLHAVWALLLVGLVIGVAGAAWADDEREPKGAAWVIGELNSIATKTAEVASSPEELALAVLASDVARFSVEVASLAAPLAAERWVGLLDQFLSLAPPDLLSLDRYRPKPAFGIRSLFEVIPPPEVWPLLPRYVGNPGDFQGKEKTRKTFLLTLFSCLNPDPKATLQYLQGLQQLSPVFRSTNGATQYLSAGLEDRLKGTLVEKNFTSWDTLSRFKLFLDQQVGANQAGSMILLPDLVSLAGMDEARTLIRRAVKIPRAKIEVPFGSATLRLAQEVVIEELDGLKTPQWGLVRSVDSIQLFDELRRRFLSSSSGTVNLGFGFGFVGKRGRNEFSFDQCHAGAYQICSLLAKGRSSEAEALLADPEFNESGRTLFWAWESIDEPVEDRVFLDFCLKEIPVCPTLAAEKDLALLAGRLGRDEELFQALVLGGKASNGERKLLNPTGLQLDRLLQTGKVEEAVQEIRKQLNASSPAEPLGPFEPVPESALAYRLVTLGDLLERPEWIKEGVAAFLRAKDLGSKVDSDPEYRGRNLVGVLKKRRLFGLAEGFLTGLFRRGTGGAEMTGQPWRDESKDWMLTELAGVYAAAGRWAEVLQLFEKAPWWGISDLAEFSKDSRLGGLELEKIDFSRRSLPSLAAEALLVNGQTDEGMAVLKHFLAKTPGDDDLYPLFLKIAGSGTVGFLDNLIKLDRFEERPLLWKAVHLKAMGQLSQAEAMVREALKVDPTDGETEPGKRVFGYGLLAEILDALGKKDDAEFFRRVVKAVRTAEEGDRFSRIGMQEEALKRFQNAEALFVDAYCVQWRLAKRLYDQGKKEEAERHFRIAFQRMPEQFGRVASLCLGCEGVFRTSFDRSVAERVFLDLLRDHPEMPQVHLLVGQLREAQKRPQEAFDSYKRAVMIDPEYLDGWKRLFSLQSALFIPQAEREEIAMRGLTLDPLGRHFRGNLEDVRDLPRLWKVLEENRKLRPALSAKLFPFLATQEKKKSQLAAGLGSDWYSGYQVGPADPVDGLTENYVLKTLIALWAAQDSRFIGD